MTSSLGLEEDALGQSSIKRTRRSIVATLLQWHRRIGLLACLAVICWGLSGLSHPIMSRLQPKPVTFSVPGQALAVESILPLSEALLQVGLTSVDRARLLSFDSQVFYRVEASDDVFYIAADSGLMSDKTDKDYAVWLARVYLGDKHSEISSVILQTDFDEDYLFINRLLPVVKVAFKRDDNMRVYVETRTGRLATLVDDNKALARSLFRQLHSWLFIENQILRVTLMSFMLVLGFGAAVMGVFIYSYKRYKFRRGLSSNAARGRVFHQRLGLIVALAAMAFSISGAYHLLNKAFAEPASPLAPDDHFLTSSLSANWPSLMSSLDKENLKAAELLLLNEEPVYRLEFIKTKPVSPAHHDHGGHKAVASAATYVSAVDGSVISEGEKAHALQLASYYSGFDRSSVRSQVIVDHFGGEYGFINKRLPVYAISYNLPGSPTIYVEPRSNALAAWVVDSDRWEGFSFAYLHKWHFLDGLGRDARDFILALFATGVVLVSLLGVRMQLKGRHLRG